LPWRPMPTEAIKKRRCRQVFDTT